jgi:predicted N-acetyltransferase YhbS
MSFYCHTFEVRRLQIKDAPLVLPLLDRTFETVQRTQSLDRDLNFWKWKYESSPYGQAIVHGIFENNRIVACGSLWPISIKHGNQSIKALEPCDTAVHPDFRRKGLFKLLNQTRMQAAIDTGATLIFNFPNSNSLPGYVRDGWFSIGRVPWFVRVMKPFSIIMDHRRDGPVSKLGVPQEWMLDISKTVELDGQLEAIYSHLSLDRVPGYWQWRFNDHPTRQYGLVGGDGNDFAVFTLSIMANGLKEMVIVDLVASPAQLPGLLDKIIASARRMQAGFIALMKPQALPSGPFYRRAFLPVPMKNLVCLPLNPALTDVATNIRNWDFRAAMHDSI